MIKLIAAFVLGFREGREDVGMTYDDSAESAQSKAYDHGRNLRRLFWAE